MQIQINVQNSTESVAESQDAKHCVIDVAESRRFIPASHLTSQSLT